MPMPMPQLVRIWFGLDGVSPINQDVTAEALGITRNRARQLEAEAMALLRKDVTPELAG